MVKNKYHKEFLFIGLFLTLFFIGAPVIYTHYYHRITGTTNAVNARIDLSAIHLGNGKTYLDGQWEFFWNNLIMSKPKSQRKPDLTIKVPNDWTQYKINGKSLPAGGFGSYRLQFYGLAYDKKVTIYIPHFGEAYRVYIDGQLTAESGRISENIGKIFTTPKVQLYPLKLSSATSHEVVIEVATTRFSGLYMTPVLCDYQKIMDANSKNNAVRFILFGIALSSLFSLIVMYITSVRRKMNSFWMPVMILFILIRIMLTTEFYSFWQPILFFHLSYETINELMYFATFVLKYLLIYLVQEQCGINFHKNEKTGFFIFYIILYLIYLFTPSDLYNHYLSIWIPLLTFVLDVYLFVKIYTGWDKMIKYGMIVFWGADLIIIGLAVESLYINGKIFIDMSLAMMIFFMIFSVIMCWVYAMRLGDLYDDFTISSSRLELANKQIDMQKQYFNTLSGQMNEIRVIKHDINHFTGTMSRLAEQGQFDRLRMFLNEYCEKTKLDQLPIFCENTIANSIIGYYYLRAKEQGISFKSQCKIGEYIQMSDSDLCIVLGNALDNAVYACTKMEQRKDSYISIEAAKMNGQQLIMISNTYNGQLRISNGQYISLKGESSHGYGMQNIKKVVETYGGFMKIEHDQEIFTVMVAILENKKRYE